MALTQEHLELLKAHFEPEQHSFDYGNNIYIKEMAISERLDSVDPSWSLSEPNIFWRDGTGLAVVEVTLVMTVGGVSRGAVGQSEIVNNKTGTKESNQAVKSAATDALKRVARLFGIGRYLLETPDNVKNVTDVRNWLGTGNKATQQAPANNWNAEVVEWTKPLYVGTDGKFNPHHQKGSLNKAVEEDAIGITITPDPLQAASVMVTRRLIAQYGVELEEIEVMLDGTIFHAINNGLEINQILAQADLFFENEKAKQ